MNGLPDEISLVNAALAKFAGGDIGDFEEDTELAGLCVKLYRDVIDAILSRHRWTCLDRTTPLQRLADAPQNGYAYAYSPPADAFSRPRALYRSIKPRAVLRDHVVEGTTVCCDEPAVWGCYGRRLSPDQWPPDLRLLMVSALAAELCVPVCEDKDLAQIFRAEAFGPPQMGGQGGLFGQAITADHAAATPNPPLFEEGRSPLGPNGGPSAFSAYPANWLSQP